MSQRLTESDLAAIEERANKATPGPWWQEGKLPNPYVYGHVRGGRPNGEGIIQCTYFGSNTKDDGANAEFIAAARTDIPALLADLRAARQERDQAREESRQLRTDLANALLAHLIKNLNEMDEVPRFAFRATPNAQLFRKWLESAATHETPCEDCPTTPVQHCCNWQIDATKEEKAE